MPSFQAHCQIAQKIVTTYDNFGLGNDSGEIVTKSLLTKYARAGLIDTFQQGGEWHFQLYAPTRIVWENLPRFFDCSIIDISGNILKKDLIVYELNPNGSFKDVVIPDSIYFEEWTFSKKSIRKLKVKKSNNNHYTYGNLSPGFQPAGSKNALNDKAKKEKKKKKKEKK